MLFRTRHTTSAAASAARRSVKIVAPTAMKSASKQPRNDRPAFDFEGGTTTALA